jgi:hypothetical protein
MISYLIRKRCKLEARAGERGTFLMGFHYLAQGAIRISKSLMLSLKKFDIFYA